MAAKQLLSQTGTPTTGPITGFSGGDGIRVFQITPVAGTPMVGTLEIKGSNKPSPGAGDFLVLATIDLKSHVGAFTVYMENTSTSIQVALTAVSSGQVSVFGDSNNGVLVGSTGTTLAQSTAVVTSQNKVTEVGALVHVSSPVVPTITSDDVTYSLNFAETTTDVLSRVDGFQTTLTGASVVTADLILLAGQSAAGLLAADFTKLATITATATEVNHTAGVTSNLQTQLAAKISGTADLTGLTVSAADFNTFFTVAPTVNIATLNTSFTGLTAAAGDLNTLTGAALAGVVAADFTKLAAITASAIELNVMDGVLATAVEINKLNGVTVTTADINATGGLGLAGLSITQFTHLTGLTQNVQAALDTITSLPALTASSNDLNLLTGAFAGTGAFIVGSLTSAELAHVNGVTGAIQVQIDTKRNTTDTIGIGEITSAVITTTELNHLQGASSNIQTQLNTITTGTITPAGGTFTGAIFIANGTAAAPGLGFAGSNTSGLYLFGADGIGLTVGGIRRATLTAADLTLGDNAVSGQPFLKHAGMAETDPTFSFVGDTDTGMYRTGANGLALAVGGKKIVEATTGTGVVLGGAVADNEAVKVTGLFAGIKELGRVDLFSVGALSAAAPRNSIIYTTPVARNAIITAILVKIVTATVGTGGYTIATNTLRLNFGFGVAFDEIVDNTNNITIWNPAYGFDTSPQVMPLGFGDNVFPAVSGSAGADYQALAAGQALTARVVTLANLDTFDLQFIALGYEF